MGGQWRHRPNRRRHPASSSTQCTWPRSSGRSPGASTRAWVAEICERCSAAARSARGRTGRAMIIASGAMALPVARAVALGARLRGCPARASTGARRRPSRQPDRRARWRIRSTNSRTAPSGVALGERDLQPEREQAEREDGGDERPGDAESQASPAKDARTRRPGAAPRTGRCPLAFARLSERTGPRVGMAKHDSDAPRAALVEAGALLAEDQRVAGQERLVEEALGATALKSRSRAAG